MSGRTTIIISHDLLADVDADAIVVLEAGAVHAIRTYHQLLATSPVYAHLYGLHPPSAQPTVGTPRPAHASGPDSTTSFWPS
ncbi:MAG: hypothetical protein JOY78_02695 [Pseudonocardia sp.]|nr:hypothetical protein [Pseudonocardia sp.]